MEPSHGASPRPDVFFGFSYEMFDDAVGREFCRPPDQTLLALAHDARVGRLLVADPWRSYVVSAARRRPVRLVEDITVAGREAIRVRPHRLRTDDSAEIGTVERSYRRYGEVLGRALARSRGEREPRPRSATLVTYHPFAAAFCDSAWIDRIVYFGQDDWATGEGVSRWWEVYREAYRRIDRRCDAIFAVSEELADRVSPRTEVVPNGVIADVWRPRHPADDRIAALPRPRVVYTGTIDDRLERSLVETTAGMAGSVVMIGYPGDAGTIEWLRSLDRVHVFDPVGQDELAAMVQACDIGMIPHRDDPCIRAMSPLKLYEYLAAGLPVLSVDLPPVHGVDDERVRICRREDWASALAQVLGMGFATEQHRQAFVDAVSWEQRMRPVVDAAVG
ncbi:glycosyltransferase [Rhodococcus zopfii]|uniref:glycosyltransferase n=1 Tax=Rhodococcus zopfii TaxID=43772 RepID=UPI0014728BDE|nr:glycosyltransferase [Rhodococcus zopfii]